MCGRVTNILINDTCTRKVGKDKKKSTIAIQTDRPSRIRKKRRVLCPSNPVIGQFEFNGSRFKIILKCIGGNRVKVEPTRDIPEIQKKPVSVIENLVKDIYSQKSLDFIGIL